jgi:hypothetical protein
MMAGPHKLPDILTVKWPRPAHKWPALFVLLTLTGSCDLYPRTVFDYSRLGDTAIDNVIKRDPQLFIGFSEYKNDKLPPENDLVRDLTPLVYRDKTIGVTTDYIRSIGGTCPPDQPDFCYYKGVISYKLNLPERKSVIRYKIEFDLSQSPAKFEVFRRRDQC